MFSLALHNAALPERERGKAKPPPLAGRLFSALLHPPDDGGDLPAGQDGAGALVHGVLGGKGQARQKGGPWLHNIHSYNIAENGPVITNKL